MIRRVSIEKLHAVASQRRAGYVQAVLAVAEPVSATHVGLSLHDYRRLQTKYAIRRPQPGTELKKLLARFGFGALEGCQCAKRAKAMNDRGCEWVESNIDTVVGWLRQEAHKRGLPFIDAIGRALVHRAVRNARRNGGS